MSEKTMTVADLVAAGHNNSTSAGRKEVMPNAYKTLVSQEQLTILAYLLSFSPTKPKDDPEAEKKRKKYTGRLKIWQKIYVEKPTDGSVPEAEYDIKHISFWTDDILVPGQFVVAIGSKSKKNYETSYYIQRVISANGGIKELFENVDDYFPNLGKNGAK